MIIDPSKMSAFISVQEKIDRFKQTRIYQEPEKGIAVSQFFVIAGVLSHESQSPSASYALIALGGIIGVLPELIKAVKGTHEEEKILRDIFSLKGTEEFLRGIDESIDRLEDSFFNREEK